MEERDAHENTGTRLTSRDTVFRIRDPPNKYHLTIKEVILIDFNVGTGMSDRKTPEKHSRSPTTVGRVRKEATGSIAQEVHLDAFPVVLSHFVAFCLLTNPSMTGHHIAKAALQAGLETSKASVNRMAAKLNFKTIFSQRTEQLSQRHKEYRVHFAHNIYTWTGFYLPWVFTDESMLVLNPRLKRIRVIRGLECEGKYAGLTGYPIKLMVWGAIAPNFKSPLIKIEGKVTAEAYKKMLISSEIFDKLNSRFGARAFVFQQDGARPHTAKSTRKFLEANVLTLPEELNWPPMSPDLSVIENLWSVLKYRIDYTTVADGESLYREASRVWDEIPIDFVNNCLGDFECRLQACAALQGDCLNEHKAVLRAFRRSRECRHWANQWQKKRV